MDTYNLHQKIDRLFEGNNKKSINTFFYGLCETPKKYLNEIKYMVDLGVDARMDDDQAFVISCRFGDVLSTNYFLSEIGVDINTQNGWALVEACHRNNEIVVEILLQNNIVVTDKVIDQIIDSVVNYNAGSMIKVLLKYCNCGERVLKKYFDTLDDGDFLLLKHTYEAGVDFGKVLSEHVVSSSDDE